MANSPNYDKYCSVLENKDTLELYFYYELEKIYIKIYALPNMEIYGIIWTQVKLSLYAKIILVYIFHTNFMRHCTINTINPTKQEKESYNENTNENNNWEPYQY